MFFNVIRNLIDTDMYYMFTDNEKVIYRGFDLPEELDDLFITKISGGENEHGEYLAFECVTFTD